MSALICREYLSSSGEEDDSEGTYASEEDNYEDIGPPPLGPPRQAIHSSEGDSKALRHMADYSSDEESDVKVSEELGDSILSAMKKRSLPGFYLPVHPGRTTRIRSRSVPDRARCRASPPVWTPQDPDKIYMYDYQDPQAFC
jgi:hypothetical protein